MTTPTKKPQSLGARIALGLIVIVLGIGLLMLRAWAVKSAVCASQGGHYNGGDNTCYIDAY